MALATFAMLSVGCSRISHAEVSMATSHISSSAVITTFFVFLILFTVLLIAEIKIMLTQIKKNEIN